MFQQQIQQKASYIASEKETEAATSRTVSGGEKRFPLRFHV
ncbi:MAG TPA: hypothetical protein VFA10_28040 [Ktedonobacteraceae bacterium]|nr:hypothetical protein [Ktedonobacteraceae bacterium]